MKWSLADLKREIEDLLEQSGFTPELYIIKMGKDYIAIHFDKKAAVDYFRSDFEYSKLAEFCIYEYKKEGRRHAAYIYSW